jgi:hypothetical protein
MPLGSSTTLLPTAADSSCSAGFGHHATHTTGCVALLLLLLSLPPLLLPPPLLPLPRAHVRQQRPVATSHSLRVPSSLPDASHCPPVVCVVVVEVYVCVCACVRVIWHGVRVMARGEVCTQAGGR